MKILAVLEDDIEVGGGFNQALNAIAQMRRICEGAFTFEVLVSSSSGAEHLTSLGIKAHRIAISPLDKLFSHVSHSHWGRALLRRMKMVSPFEKHLIAHGCDLVYFVRQSPLAHVLQRHNFVTTLFDLCHRDAPEFPEVRDFGEFQLREHLFRTNFAGAVIVLTDSTALAEAAVRRYGLDADRLLAMPFAPAVFLDEGTSNDKRTVLQKYGLAEGYLFYPAKFWAHKNHARILESLALLRGGGLQPQVVFCGRDGGNLQHVHALASGQGLLGQVRFLGPVPGEDMRGLYEACGAVIMPTYFGPTNLPPLEAWTLGKPLIYSLRCAEQAGDAALCVDPDNAAALADAIRRVSDAETAADLAKRGTLRLRQLEQQRSEAEADLRRRLRQFEARRRCWA